jgi:hypothetical protein
MGLGAVLFILVKGWRAILTATAATAAAAAAAAKDVRDDGYAQARPAQQWQSLVDAPGKPCVT